MIDTETDIQIAFLLPFVLATMVPAVLFVIGLAIFQKGTRKRKWIGGVVMVLAVLLMVVWLIPIVVTALVSWEASRANISQQDARAIVLASCCLGPLDRNIV